jgi:hypothetical protein
LENRGSRTRNRSRTRIRVALMHYIFVPNCGNVPKSVSQGEWHIIYANMHAI